LHAIVAFSGQILGRDINDEIDHFPDDKVFTEESMNPNLHGQDLRTAFDQNEYRVMIVANKYQTGFDQPKLVAMYLDKKVSGIEAVQTLSRLNRTFPGKDKTYVIDFVNKTEEIVAAFRQYYKDVHISDIQDPNVVYDMRDRLQEMQIFEPEEVRQFALAIASPLLEVTAEKLFSLTQSATDRFNGRMKMLNDAIVICEREFDIAKRHGDQLGISRAEIRRSEHTKSRDELIIFSEGLTKFVKTYEYIAQLVDLGDASMEGFAAYAKLLRKRLKGITAEQIDLSDLTLTHFKLLAGTALPPQWTGDAPDLKAHTGSGGREPRDREREYLVELIKKLNDTFGKEVTDKDKVAFAIHISETVRTNATVMAQVRNNSMEQAMRADLPGAVTQAIVSAMKSHSGIAKKLLSEEDTRNLFLGVVYELLKKDVAPGLLIQARESN